MVLQKLMENEFGLKLRRMIYSMCRDGLPFVSTLCVDGTIAITIDNLDVVVISLKDVLVNSASDVAAGQEAAGQATVADATAAQPQWNNETDPMLRASRKRPMPGEDEQALGMKKKRKKNRKKTKLNKDSKPVAEGTGEEVATDATKVEQTKPAPAEGGQFTCELCSRNFVMKESLEQHRHNKHSVPYQCQHCQFSCINKGDLKKHDKTTHPATNAKAYPRVAATSQNPPAEGGPTYDHFSDLDYADNSEFVIMDEYRSEPVTMKRQTASQEGDAPAPAANVVEPQGKQLNGEEKDQGQPGQNTAPQAATCVTPEGQTSQQDGSLDASETKFTPKVEVKVEGSQVTVDAGMGDAKEGTC